MSRKYAQLKKTSLAYSISDSETTIRLTTLLKLDGTSVSSADIGDYMTGTFDPGTSKEEIFSIASSGVNVNADGTVDITGVVRGLKEVDPYTTGGYSAEHGAGAVVVISNNPQLYDQFANKSNANTFTALNTFDVAPQISVDPVAGNDAVRLSYVQALILGTLTTINVIVPGTAGATISAGNLIYFDETDNKWKLCDADTDSTVNNVLLGIAQGSGTDGNPVTDGILLQGVDANQTSLTEGDVEYASNVAGGISSTPGTTEVTVGIAKSTTELYFSPRFNQMLTENQQDGLETTTPLSTTNKAMTQKDLQIGAEIYGADAGANDTYVITLSPVPSAYVTGMTIRFKANTINTGAATLNVNSLGAKTIVKGVSTTLSDGDIPAGQFCTVIYDGTNFVLQNTPATQGLLQIASASDVLRLSADTVNNNNNAGTVLEKTIRVSYGGVIRVKFAGQGNGFGGSGRIYVNGVATGTTRSFANGSYTTYSEDITINASDLVQLYSIASGGSITDVKEFRIYFDLTAGGDGTVILD